MYTVLEFLVQFFWNLSAWRCRRSHDTCVASMIVMLHYCMCYSATVRGSASAAVGSGDPRHPPSATPRVRRGRRPGAAQDRRSLQGSAQVLDGGHQQLGPRRVLASPTRKSYYNT